MVRIEIRLTCYLLKLLIIFDTSFAFFLESDNTLSIFPYDKNKFETYPIPIILDGTLNDFLLKELHLTKEKIEKMLIRDNLLIEDIYYAMYENNKLFIIRKDELK